MNNEIIKELTRLNEVELIYSNKKLTKDKMILSYNIVCNIDSVVSNIEICKKIIAIMEIIKELFTKYNVLVNYNIKTSYAFEEEISNKKLNNITKHKNIELLYAKSSYFNDLINSNEVIKSK